MLMMALFTFEINITVQDMFPVAIFIFYSFGLVYTFISEIIITMVVNICRICALQHTTFTYIHVNITY